jgi:hypothetical protein
MKNITLPIDWTPLNGAVRDVIHNLPVSALSAVRRALDSAQAGGSKAIAEITIKGSVLGDAEVAKGELNLQVNPAALVQSSGLEIFALASSETYRKDLNGLSFAGLARKEGTAMANTDSQPPTPSWVKVSIESSGLHGWLMDELPKLGKNDLVAAKSRLTGLLAGDRAASLKARQVRKSIRFSGGKLVLEIEVLPARLVDFTEFAGNALQFKQLSALDGRLTQALANVGKENRGAEAVPAGKGTKTTEPSLANA